MEGYGGRRWNSPQQFGFGHRGGRGSPYGNFRSPGPRPYDFSPRGNLPNFGGGGRGWSPRWRSPYGPRSRFNSPDMRGHQRKSMWQRLDYVQVDQYLHPSMLEDPWKEFSLPEEVQKPNPSASQDDEHLPLQGSGDGGGVFVQGEELGSS